MKLKTIKAGIPNRANLKKGFLLLWAKNMKALKAGTTRISVNLPDKRADGSGLTVPNPDGCLFHVSKKIPRSNKQIIIRPIDSVMLLNQLLFLFIPLPA